MSRTHWISIISALLCSGPLIAEAQTIAPPQSSPNVPDRSTTVPEKIEPQQDPRSTAPARPAESLSERLDRTEGVIKPPDDLNPEMSVKPPLQDRGEMPVIAPPGSAGGDSNVTPK
jgi:hypothetical protein